MSDASDERLIDVIRRGDGELGSALLRLARIAEASHRFTVAAEIASCRFAGPTRSSKVCTDADPAAAPRRGSSVCTEVNR